MLLAAAPAHAEGLDGFCHDLTLAVASADEREAFASVTFHENWARFRLFELCRPNRLGPVDRVHCSWQLASAAPVLDSLAAEAVRCLPGAVRDDAGAPYGLGEAQARLRLGELTIYIYQSISAPGVLADSAAVMVMLADE